MFRMRRVFVFLALPLHSLFSDGILLLYLYFPGKLCVAPLLVHGASVRKEYVFLGYYVPGDPVCAHAGSLAFGSPPLGKTEEEVTEGVEAGVHGSYFTCPPIALITYQISQSRSRCLHG